ncbi:unnamed protein product [Leptidea sinapis]|uniref:Uncharacterized protein n=1 Tax=Leptidea sinapis TaxID=189913 RepID=A0A5E4R1H3_9NEOP|nr:unnamed protein product [Leptidea sinapis]
MLKFLTHKLRTHSLNEENVSEKVEERDSGTESDDEAERTDTGGYCADVIMKWNDSDQLYDHHSSEEELEVINGSEGSTASAEGGAAPRSEGRRRGASSPARTAPEKRRWPAEPYDEELATRAPSSDDDDTKVRTSLV